MTTLMNAVQCPVNIPGHLLDEMLRQQKLPMGGTKQEKWARLMAGGNAPRGRPPKDCDLLASAKSAKKAKVSDDREEFVRKQRKTIIEELGITDKDAQDEEIERRWQMRAKAQPPPTFDVPNPSGIIKLHQKLSQAQARELGATFITMAVDDDSHLPVYLYQKVDPPSKKVVSSAGAKRGGGKPVTTVELPPQTMLKKRKKEEEEEEEDSEDEEEYCDGIIKQVMKRIKKRMSTETIKQVLVEYGEDPSGSRHKVAEKLAEQMYLESDSDNDDDA